MPRRLLWFSILILSLTGCFKDKHEGYTAVMDKQGEIVPRDPIARTFEPAPDPHSTTLIPAKKKEEPAKVQEEAPPKEQLPDAFFGIPTYPNAQYAEGQHGVVTSGTMKQVFLETRDIPAFVDTFYINKMPPDARSESEGVHGKVIVYTFPVLGQEVRTLAIANLGRTTQIVMTSMQDPVNHAFTSTAPPRSNSPSPLSTKTPKTTPSKPVTPLPAMPTSPTQR